jgi:hypothetical protein
MNVWVTIRRVLGAFLRFLDTERRSELAEMVFLSTKQADMLYRKMTAVDRHYVSELQDLLSDLDDQSRSPYDIWHWWSFAKCTQSHARGEAKALIDALSETLERGRLSPGRESGWLYRMVGPSEGATAQRPRLVSVHGAPLTRHSWAMKVLTRLGRGEMNREECVRQVQCVLGGLLCQWQKVAKAFHRVKVACGLRAACLEMATNAGEGLLQS